MKVLFLDIDGVVNCVKTRQRHRGAIGIDPYMAFMVGQIVLQTDCQVVLSSSWRHWPDGCEEVRRQVIDFIDVTPSIPLQGGAEMMERGKEILAWLEDHPEVERYAILDDGSDFLPDQPLFQTSWEIGITEEIKNKVIEFLNSDTPYNGTANRRNICHESENLAESMGAKTSQQNDREIISDQAVISTGSIEQK